MPWWVIMSFLIGAVTLCAAGVVIVDGQFGTPAAETSLIGKVQRWPVFVTLGLTVLITGFAIGFFAHLSITTFGFKTHLKHGFGCIIVPLYSLIYGSINWIDNKAPVKAMLIGFCLIGFGAYLVVQGGGFQQVIDAFR